jgi:hypothetical protein
LPKDVSSIYIKNDSKWFPFTISLVN